MYPACRRLVVLAWLVFGCVSFADQPVSEPECADDVCVFNVIATGLISAPCVGYSVLVAYSRSSGTTLIQCSNSNSAEENKSFVYDRHDPAVKPFEFLGGRFIRPAYLTTAQTDGIPDKFGPVPLCATKNRRPAAGGQLLIVDKQRNDSDADAYCYRVNYVISGKGRLLISDDEGHELPSLSDEAAKKWRKLQATLARYVDTRRMPRKSKGSRIFRGPGTLSYPLSTSWLRIKRVPVGGLCSVKGGFEN